MREIEGAKLQTVNGYIWKLKLKVYPLTSTSEANDFSVSFDGWTKGDFTDVGFNVKMGTEDSKGFTMSEEEDEGSFTGLMKARVELDETLDETMAGNQEDKIELAKMGGVIAIVGLCGIALGFFIKHKIAESRVAKLQTQLTAFERMSTGKGGNQML